MQMELPAPAGVVPVELATVVRGPMSATVLYTGQAVGYVEQEVAPRVPGTLVWMPFYAGDRVRRGQLLARLDTSQSAPQVASQRAVLNMAVQGVGVARKEYQQTMASIHEAHAEVGMVTGALAGARAELTAAQEGRANAAAQLDAARSMTPDAEAQLQGAQADQGYWRDEIVREASLLKAGAVTGEEYGRERAQADNAAAKVRQAQARVVQVAAQVRAAQADVSRSEAMIAAAQAKVEQAEAERDSHFAHVRSSQAMADSAQQKIVQAEAGVEQARATLAGVAATQGYSAIRAETDGLVMQRVVSPGVLVGPGQTLLKIARIDPIRLQANVPEADLPKLRVGGVVRVAGMDGTRPLMAHITSISPAVDPTARTAIVETVVPNPDGRFRPGQYVTLELSVGGSAAALQVPTRAVRTHTPPSGEVISTRAVATVWVADPVAGEPDQYTAREATVQVGVSDADRTQILSGLMAGEKVVLAGQDNLHAGDAISPTGAIALASHPEIQNPNALLPTPPTHQHYTCIMHPEIDLDHPGNCPICGMKLVPKRMGAR